MRGTHGEPFAVLGAHAGAGQLTVRAFAPDAESAELVPEGGEPVSMRRIHDAGLFAVTTASRPARYEIAARNSGGEWRFIDPYQFGPVLGAMDEHLISEGAHMRLWRTLGARPMSHEGVDGVTFAVWAPSARRVSVVGAFNGWDGRRHPMRRRGVTGVWELFIPSLEANGGL